jgi:hypothetical protein
MNNHECSNDTGTTYGVVFHGRIVPAFGRTAWALRLGALGSRPVLTVLTDGRSLYSRISDDGLAGGGKWGGWSAACALKV